MPRSVRGLPSSARRAIYKQWQFGGALTKFGRRGAAPVAILAVPILPDQVDYRFDIAVYNAMAKIGKQIQSDLMRTTATWAEHKVEWLTEKKGHRGHIVVNLRGDKVGCPADEAALSIYNTSMIWKFVNEGTESKGVVLINYSPRTEPGKLSSGPGGMDSAGAKKFYHGYSASQAKILGRNNSLFRGIPPRGWTGIIVKKYDGPLTEAVDDAIASVIARKR